ncbi:hypothetical protein BFP97_01295 [Roseivirga sp. 4D4]|nr:hypothetical protein BFP97_01295 [Roseivirga sp. 4D4]
MLRTFILVIALIAQPVIAQEISKEEIRNTIIQTMDYDSTFLAEQKVNIVYVSRSILKPWKKWMFRSGDIKSKNRDRYFSFYDKRLSSYFSSEDIEFMKGQVKSSKKIRRWKTPLGQLEFLRSKGHAETEPNAHVYYSIPLFTKDKEIIVLNYELHVPHGSFGGLFLYKKDKNGIYQYLKFISHWMT